MRAAEAGNTRAYQSHFRLNVRRRRATDTSRCLHNIIQLFIRISLDSVLIRVNRGSLRVGPWRGRCSRTIYRGKTRRGAHGVASTRQQREEIPRVVGTPVADRKFQAERPSRIDTRHREPLDALRARYFDDSSLRYKRIRTLGRASVNRANTYVGSTGGTGEREREKRGKNMWIVERVKISVSFESKARNCYLILAMNEMFINCWNDWLIQVALLLQLIFSIFMLRPTPTLDYLCQNCLR